LCRPWRSLIVVVCILPLNPVMIKISGSTIHPSWDRNGWRMAYLSSFQLVIIAGNLSLQYVNSIICTLTFGFGVKGCLYVVGAPKMPPK
jgi:hypothetical protein